MGATTNSRNIRIFVLASLKTVGLLPGFTERFEKFWGEPFTVLVSNTSLDNWSDGVISFLNILPDEFILLHEDFYITEPVGDIDAAWELLHASEKMGRVNLEGPYDGDHLYRCSFQASLWKKKCLFDALAPHEDPWAAERDGTKRLISKGWLHCAAKTPVVQYKDAMRRGKLCV